MSVRMSAMREAGLTALRELRRNLRSTKGIAMFVLFFLGGAVPSVVQVLFLRLVDKTTMKELPQEMQRKMFEEGLTQLYDAATAAHLATCPPVLFGLFRGTLLFLPLLILLIGFDQIAGEIQHRSIRYLVGRARREAIVAGKGLGVWAVSAVMVLVLHATVWIVMLVQGSTPASAVLAWGPRLWLFSVGAGAAYVGLTALVSSFFRTPIVALFAGVAVFFVLWLANTILGLFEATEGATWAFPATYEKLLVAHEPLRALGGLAALICWGVVMAAVASAIVKRRDV
jgi:ABC-type transport system involved in multi-copper enzyme maturation permease subunit